MSLTIKNYEEIPFEKLELNEFELHKKQKKQNKKLQKVINELGFMDPIAVCPHNGKYLVVDGIIRLIAWRELYKDKPIPCVVLEYSSDKGADKKDKMEEIKKNAHAMNMIRFKMPREKREAFIWELHKKEFGYKAIAAYTGYTKSGIQKIINRMQEQENNPISAAVSVPSKRLVSKIKRIRTQLVNLIQELNIENNEDKVNFEKVREFLEVHEETMREELQSKKSSKENQTQNSVIKNSDSEA